MFCPEDRNELISYWILISYQQYRITSGKARGQCAGVGPWLSGLVHWCGAMAQWFDALHWCGAMAQWFGALMWGHGSVVWCTGVGPWLSGLVHCTGVGPWLSGLACWCGAMAQWFGALHW